MTSKVNEKSQTLNRILRETLTGGLIISAAMIGLGLLLTTFEQNTTPASGYNAICHGLRQGKSDAFLNLGLLLLIATPVFRVVGSLAGFVLARDWRFVGVTLLVLTILTIGVISGLKL